MAINYGKPADNQMELELPGLSSSGMELMGEARHWVGEHFNEWVWFKQQAIVDTQSEGFASAKWLVEGMRRRYKVSCKNAYAPCLARIAMEEDSRIYFKTAKSAVDGFTTAKLERK